MSSKVEHAARLSMEHARAAKQEYILRGNKANTHSAREPAYLFTSLCSDPGRRVPPRQRKREVGNDIFNCKYAGH